MKVGKENHFSDDWKTFKRDVKRMAKQNREDLKDDWSSVGDSFKNVIEEFSLRRSNNKKESKNAKEETDS